MHGMTCVCSWHPIAHGHGHFGGSVYLRSDMYWGTGLLTRFTLEASRNIPSTLVNTCTSAPTTKARTLHEEQISVIRLNPEQRSDVRNHRAAGFQKIMVVAQRPHLAIPMHNYSFVMTLFDDEFNIQKITVRPAFSARQGTTPGYITKGATGLVTITHSVKAPQLCKTDFYYLLYILYILIPFDQPVAYPTKLWASLHLLRCGSSCCSCSCCACRSHGT